MMRIGFGFFAVCLLCALEGRADTFGEVGNQFHIEFVPIPGNTNPAEGPGIVNNDYRIGVLETSIDQWDKFSASCGTAVAGNPMNAYDEGFTHRLTCMPANEISWYEAAQFVNWLNTSTGHRAAYRFTGTPGKPDYTFDTWGAADAAGETNLYRHKDAKYYLPTEDEWVKAAYWNGRSLQALAAKPPETLSQGDYTGFGWNYNRLFVPRPRGVQAPNGFDVPPYGPAHAREPLDLWRVGNGSDELNGTRNMMGNAVEWVESSYSGSYDAEASRTLRGGGYVDGPDALQLSERTFHSPCSENPAIGFRVASSMATASEQSATD